MVPGCESRGPGSDILCDNHRSALWPRDGCELIKAWRSGDVGRYQCELGNALTLLTGGR